MNRQNLFITTYDGEWKGVAEVLRERLDFRILELHGAENGNFPSKRQILRKELDSCKRIRQHLKEIDDANLIICPDYCALYLLQLKKKGKIHCGRILWFGMYIHSPKMIRLVKRVIHAAMPKENTADDPAFRIVVFSRPETALYAREFDLPAWNFLYVPYGEWKKDKQIPETENEGYFFSGGYANRDFVTLAKLFQNKPWKLVIAASRANTDFVEYCETTSLSDNIRVYWDIPYEEFNRLLRYCFAMILIMKYNTGASGQILLLTAQECSKLIIASYTDVVDEYVKDGVTGIILKDKEQETLDHAMAFVTDPANADKLGELAQAGHQHYITH